MNLFNKIKLGAGGTVLVGALGLAGWQFSSGDAQFHVIVPYGRTVEVSAGGSRLLPAYTSGPHLRFNLPQGDHAVSIKDEESGKVTTHKLSLPNGFADFTVPIDDHQCFARFDVTDTSYGKSIAEPKVVGRYTDKIPFETPSSSYLSDAEMPASIKEHEKVHLLLEMPCEEVSAKGNDEKLVELAGY